MLKRLGKIPLLFTVYLLISSIDYFSTWYLIKDLGMPLAEGNPITAKLLENNVPAPLGVILSPIIYLAMRIGGEKIAKAIVTLGSLPILLNLVTVTIALALMSGL